MEHHTVKFISLSLIFIATTCVEHINLIEGAMTSQEVVATDDKFIGATKNQGPTYISAGYAAYDTEGMYGVRGKLNLWEPNTSPNAFSTAKIAIGRNHQGQLVTEISAGWMVHRHFLDGYPRIFAAYMDNNSWIRCYTRVHHCPGFEITIPRYFTDPMTETSIQDGEQRDIDVKILLDYYSNNWKLSINGASVGHWKANYTSGMYDAGNFAKWGGKIVIADPSDVLATAMGSGKFTEGDFVGKASYIAQVQYFDKHYQIKNPQNLRMYGHNHSRYTVSTLIHTSANGSCYFYYGGGGYPFA